MSYNDRKKFVKCIKHPYKDHKTEDCTDSIGKCYICEKQNEHHPLLCPAKRINSRSNLASCKASSTDPNHVMLKTIFVKTLDPNQLIGVIEDNCSTDDYITHAKAKELKLKSVCDIVLEIEGINSVKQIDSKVYRVPLQDKKNNLHFVECYGLNEITKESTPSNLEKYNTICKALGVKPKNVQRPRQIDMLLSAKSNYLMSDNVLRSHKGLKLYSGPLGMTISGNTDVFGHPEHIKSYPSRATPIVSSVKRASVVRTFTDKEILDFFKE